jgi:uncharacterized membrane protein
MKTNDVLKAQRTRETRQLRRLEILMDVVFGVVIWRFFFLLPRPSKGALDWDSMSMFLSANLDRFVIATLGIIIVIVYWVQNNALFGNLERTDNRHTAISIFQIFFLLLFLYSIRIGLVFEGSVSAKIFESVAAALLGFASVLGWFYAMKNHRLLSEDVSRDKALEVLDRTLVEPVTALITIPCAFIGPYAWEAAWFLYPLVLGLMRRLKISRVTFG